MNRTSHGRTCRVLALAAVAAAGVVLTPAAFAAKPKPSASSVGDQALLDKAAAYLQGLRSAEARFRQTDARGAVTTGTFSLQRPGRARFAYDPPTELTVVADGTEVNVYDGKLKTFDHYPEKNTPLALLLGDKVRFDKPGVVTAVTRDRAGFTITARSKEAEGKLSLSFTEAPLALAGWSVVDAQNQITTVRLEGLRTGVALAPDLFVLRDPHPHSFKP